MPILSREERRLHIDQRRHKQTSTTVAPERREDPPSFTSAEMRKAEGPSEFSLQMTVPLDKQFPQLRAGARAFDPFKGSRAVEAPGGKKSMLAAGRPSLALSSYVPRDRATGVLDLRLMFRKIVDILGRLTGGMELLAVEHAILSLVFRGYPAPLDPQAREMVTGVTEAERRDLVAFVLPRLNRYVDVGQAGAGTVPVVERKG